MVVEDKNSSIERKVPVRPSSLSFLVYVYQGIHFLEMGTGAAYTASTSTLVVYKHRLRALVVGHYVDIEKSQKLMYVR